MIQENPVHEPVHQGVPSVATSTEAVSTVARVEPCEFEKLLERAMEILATRHLEAQLKATRL